MAALALIRTAANMLAKGVSRSKVLSAIKDKHSSLSDSLAKRIIDKANEATRLSDKTGKPISELVKRGTGSQTVTKNVAKRGAATGAVAGGAGIAGLDALVDAISEATSDRASADTSSSTRRKSPEGGQTIVENRRVVSETKLARGGMPKKANCGASVPPAQKSSKS